MSDSRLINTTKNQVQEPQQHSQANPTDIESWTYRFCWLIERINTSNPFCGFCSHNLLHWRSRNIWHPTGKKESHGLELSSVSVTLSGQPQQSLNQSQIYSWFHALIYWLNIAFSGSKQTLHQKPEAYRTHIGLLIDHQPILVKSKTTHILNKY